jgi:hypothetical protein
LSNQRGPNFHSCASVIVMIAPSRIAHSPSGTNTGLNSDPFTLPSSSRDCIAMGKWQNEWRQGKTGQTAGFQNFRMRTFKVKGNCRHHKKANSFIILKPLSFTVKRWRSKILSLVCLSRFLEFLALIPNTTQSENNF